MPAKAHEVGIGRGSLGTTQVRSVLPVMSSEEEIDWEHFCFVVSMGRGSVDVVSVRSALTVMSLKEEMDWKHFCSFSDMFGC